MKRLFLGCLELQRTVLDDSESLPVLLPTVLFLALLHFPLYKWHTFPSQIENWTEMRFRQSLVLQADADKAHSGGHKTVYVARIFGTSRLVWKGL